TFDRGHLRWLIRVDIPTSQMSEQKLDRHQQSSETEAHAQHDTRLSVILLPQQIPCARRGNAEGAGKIGSKQHMGKSRPHYRIEEDPGPIVGNEGAVFQDITCWYLHPAVVDHDPECRKRG